MRRKQETIPVREALSILGLPETSTLEDVKRAYRRKAKETHPDKGGDVVGFVKVKAAYDSLVELGMRILQQQQVQPVRAHTHGTSASFNVESLREMIRNMEAKAECGTSRSRSNYANVVQGVTWWRL